ncbi:3-keto-L-gulonate-6-phosphate decarboxylase UlaD [Mycoplasmoides pneumoniae]|uniref:3-keto-L-gulonate-6-phosphate decarboxylase UlaD n=1 Tax=Mycoplasmoides pneumoniae TaxID=2104 RepID=UPI000A29EF9D|nr:3-keto-L-gulonate-6-phosphate decarboxylase UlaD [Mycoplasmoides pneumoniae]ARQ35356.1 3-keto-L-gulonate-6-phosphate decarboxylase [Mycoplasmoides pneumoniae]
MALPLIQIALDNLSLASALNDLAKVGDAVDVIEVGTILLTTEGVNAVKEIAKRYPHKLIVADGKIADAGKVFSQMFFDAGAHFTTVICAAELPTVKDVVTVGNSYTPIKETQVEMTSNFTWEQVTQWKQVGVQQVVWHRSRDAQAAGVNWSDKDLQAVKRLADLGFKVTVTGGITLNDIQLFKDIPIYIFIAGRTIRDASDPLQTVQQFKDEFHKYWK